MEIIRSVIENDKNTRTGRNLRQTDVMQEIYTCAHHIECISHHIRERINKYTSRRTYEITVALVSPISKSRRDNKSLSFARKAA